MSILVALRDRWQNLRSPPNNAPEWYSGTETGPIDLYDRARDPISPTRISHDVDAGFDGAGRLHFLYNFIVYEFERDGEVVRARTYLAESQRCHLLLAPNAEIAATLRADVLRYLAVRFAVIEEMGPNGYAPVRLPEGSGLRANASRD